MSEKYKQKNTLYNSEDNQPIDNILCTIEHLDLVSERFKQKISMICLFVLQSKGTDDNIKTFQQLTRDLKELMASTMVLSEKFQEFIIIELVKGFGYETYKTKGRLKEEINKT